MAGIKSFLWAFFIVVIFFVIGGIFAGIAAFELKEYFDSAEWPVAEGKITRLSLDEDYDSEDGTTYRAFVEYVFRVDGLEYHGNRHQFGGDIYSSDRGRAQRVVNAYEIGQEVDVYYNPEAPSANVLIREVDWLLWLFFAIGAILMLVGILITLSILFGAVRNKMKPIENLESGDFLLENEKFKL